MTAPGPTPAWGTAPEQTGVYAVVGFFVARGDEPLNARCPRAGTRFFDHIEAPDPRAAEDRARAEFSGQVEDGVTYDLEVCGVLTVTDGRIRPVDSYATYLDPDRPEAP